MSFRRPSITEIAEEARAIHSRLLAETIRTRQTTGSCLHASVLLAELLNKFGDCQGATVKGGDGCGDGGYRDQAGTWHGHYWVEVQCSTGVFVADITADQFHERPILVLPIEQAIGFVAGDQDVVDEHVAEYFSGLES